MKKFKLGLLRFFLLLPILALSFSMTAAESICSKVKIEIAQELTFERQAFEATMTISNAITDTDLENVNVELIFKNKDGNPVVATTDTNATGTEADPIRFFFNVSSMKNISNVSGTGKVPQASASEIKWLIIPTLGASGQNPNGVQYSIGAKLTYSIKGVENVTEVVPDTIYVKPMPKLRLDYFIPGQVYSDDPFTTEVEPAVPFGLGVRVANIGYGSANNLKIDSGQPRIVENVHGLLI